MYGQTITTDNPARLKNSALPVTPLPNFARIIFCLSNRISLR
jgi:hypothetical protein